jgi:hypothetical protein
MRPFLFWMVILVSASWCEFALAQSQSDQRASVHLGLVLHVTRSNPTAT